MGEARYTAVARYVQELMREGLPYSGAVAQAAADYGLSPQAIRTYVSRAKLIAAERGALEAVKRRYPQRQFVEVQNGIVMVGSDGHFWPGPASTAWRGFVKLTREFGKEVKAGVLNGDMVDGSSISRYPPIGWERRPKVVEELEATQERLAEFEAVLPPKAEKIWNLGNHDARFETRLASTNPEYARVHGVHLRDHFPTWKPAWSTWINEGPGGVVIKHRFKGGIHATHNNTLWAGRTMVTGHLHSGKVTPLTDYNGRRYGVDTGTLADPEGEQFTDYTEDNPKNWTSSFVVLTFWKGRLLQPELALVLDDDHIEFRGKAIKV